MKIFDWFIKFLGFEVDGDKKTVQKKKYSVVKSSFDLQNSGSKFNLESNFDKEIIDNKNEYKIIEAENQEDIQLAIDELKIRGNIKINISRIKQSEIQRIMDFLMGSIYALNAKISEIDDNIYLIDQGDIIEK